MIVAEFTSGERNLSEPETSDASTSRSPATGDNSQPSNILIRKAEESCLSTD